MKKSVLLNILILTVFISFGQINSEKTKKSKNEYRYFGFKIGTLTNFSIPYGDNKYVLMKTPYGDLSKSAAMPFTVSPSYDISLIYHFDAKNDRRGFVTGLSIRRFAFSTIYKPTNSDLKFKLTRTFSAFTASIPFYLKFNTSSIYKNQSYFTAGFLYNYYIFVTDRQKASWSGLPYMAYLPKEETKGSSLSWILGFNYRIFYLNVEYLLSNFVNTKYQVQTEEGTVQPYTDIGKTNNLYLQAGINIPLTRWLTARNWTAEKIRRFFKPKQ